MDPLSDLLPSMRVTSVAYTKLEASAPWGLDFIPYHHTKFGLVLTGQVWINLRDDTAPVELHEGSCYLLPRGDAFTLRDEPRSATVNFEDAAEAMEGRILRLGNGASAMMTTIVGGRFLFEDSSYPPLLDVLPALMTFRLPPQESAALLATIQLLASEAGAPALGTPLVVDRLADIFFVQTLRAYLGSQQGHDVKWLGAVGDAHIGRALRLLHAEPDRAWTLDTLAAAVHMSRSAFALRFKQRVGEAPMEYLARCRLHKAERLLRESEKSLAEIAGEIGYETEASFNKAFKRRHNVPPGQYRLTQRKLKSPG